MAVLGLRFCARAFSSCGERGPLFIVMCGPLTIAASLVAEHRLQTRRLSNCGSRTQLLCGMWDLPRPGLEPVSPALAGRLSTTVPPGKSLYVDFKDFLAWIRSVPSLDIIVLHKWRKPFCVLCLMLHELWSVGINIILNLCSVYSNLFRWCSLSSFLTWIF